VAGRPAIKAEKQPAIMALMPLKVGQLKEGLRGGTDGGGE
jgi:hypothetical protein